MKRFFLLLFISVATSSLFDGRSPVLYRIGEPIPLKVHNLVSSQTLLPYKYYELPFPRPSVIKSDQISIEENLRGEKIQNSLYEIHALQNVDCGLIGVSRIIDPELTKLKKFIESDYRVRWSIDGMPAGTKHDGRTKNYFYEEGFCLGTHFIGFNGEPNLTFLNNHVMITLRYRLQDIENGSKAIYIVGFEVEPRSIQSKMDYTCSYSAQGQQLDQGTDFIAWTYQVEWIEESDITFDHRYDPFIRIEEVAYHQSSLLTSLFVVFLLAISIIWLIRLRSDHIAMHGAKIPPSVFHQHSAPPKYPIILSVLIGSGIQVLGTGLFVILLSPFQGIALKQGILFYGVMGFYAGYFLIKTLGPQNNWKKIYALNNIFPMIFFGIFLWMNQIAYSQHSSSALRFTPILQMLLTYIMTSVISVSLGRLVGLRIRSPTVERKEAKFFPSPLLDIAAPSSKYQHIVQSFITLLWGLLPFGVVFVEFFFTLLTLVNFKTLFTFGWLVIYFLVLLIVSAQVSILATRNQLSKENSIWWWRSFLSAGSSGFWMFLYCIFFLLTKTRIESVVIWIFLGYSVIISLGFFLLTGTMGFLATFLFVKKFHTKTINLH
eukprot:TRINITY_DN3389_c0_g1_i4.p1 TRINITY_DN3389_c0_g1~~TRINITY_DN3389_c0_g1_i4.p1  ORF type:complete len:602 (+),score=66.89 TRINITY_DN3389_c0_g1_i4:3-1808(+)